MPTIRQAILEDKEILKRFIINMIGDINRFQVL